jgi:alkanesulfonate monooxygenase
VRERAQAAGRTLRFGARFDVIARATEEEAWAEARRIYDAIDPAVIAKAQQQKGGKAGRDAVFGGADRQEALRRGTGFEDLIVGPNVWAGLGLARGGPSCAFVGSYANVAERILEYHANGVTTFILAGTPHLEEGLRVGQEVLPLVHQALRHPRSQTISVADPDLVPAG